MSSPYITSVWQYCYRLKIQRLSDYFGTAVSGEQLMHPTTRRHRRVDMTFFFLRHPALLEVTANMSVALRNLRQTVPRTQKLYKTMVPYGVRNIFTENPFLFIKVMKGGDYRSNSYPDYD